MVNIIIPAYNAHDTIRQAIASVCVQENQHEIKLTIVDDCSGEPYDYLLNDYGYININLMRTPFNSGPGQARQYGIDRTDCEYLIFLDADDCFYTTDAVKTLLSTIRRENADVIASSFLQETQTDDAIIHCNDFLWMHGKIYRTQYIKERGISFNETRANADSAYNFIILNSGASIYFIDNITYVWKHNSKSLTRSGNFAVDTIADFIINARYAVSESIRLSADPDRLRECVYKYLVTMYAYYIYFLNEQKNPEFIKEYILNVKKYYENIPIIFTESIGDGYINTLFYNNMAIRNMIISNNIMMHIPFFNFLFLLEQE